MKLTGVKQNRAAIYVFFDRDGIVDRYVEYFLADLSKTVQRLVIVANGKLPDESRKKLEQYSQDVFDRENKGYDIAAYRAGMEYIGWKELPKYDEVVVLNDTIYGPVYPLREMFDAMAERDLDFWGITRHYRVDCNPFNCEYGYVPEHIQSYFMVFRKSLMKTGDFIEYWKNLPVIESYKDAVGQHELRFTKYFGDKEFQWDTYMDTEDLKDMNPQPLMAYAKELIEKQHCPIFKRRLFFQDYDWMIENTVGQVALEAYEYIRDHTSYDTEMVMENLLRVYNQADVAKCLHFNYILPSNICDEKSVEKVLKEHRVALVMHIHYPDLLENDYRYVSAMPKEADIYLVTNEQRKKKLIEKQFAKLGCHHLEIRVTQNRGRDIASLLTATKDVVFQYEYICFVHDKKTRQISLGSVGEGFSYKCFENMLYNTHYIKNILRTFEENPRLGILSPPDPFHADYFPTIGDEWGDNFEITKELAEKMNLNVVMEEEKEHQSPLGDYFWFRTKALKRLFDMNWTYDDYPEEPVGVDGSLLHAIERVLAFVAQADGYYSGHVMVDHYAKMEYTSMRHQIRGFNKALMHNNIIRLKASDAHEYLENVLGGLEEYGEALVKMSQYEGKIEYQKQLIQQIYDSTSWKITAPLRAIMKFFTGK